MYIAITGGIGSGKSFAAQILAKNLRAPKFDLDKLAKILYKSPKVIRKLSNNPILRPFFSEGSLNFTNIRQAISNDANILTLLSNILHPILLEVVRRKINSLKVFGVKNAIFEVPLLFQACGFSELFDFRLNIETSKELRRSRVRNRSNSMFNAMDMMQICPKIRAKLADLTIKNNLGRRNFLESLAKVNFRRLKSGFHLKI